MTPEWVAAIAGIAAAAIALVALAMTLKLYGKQSESLEVTIKALNAELSARRREELAAREEQARNVEIEWTGRSTMNFDENAVRSHMASISEEYFDSHFMSGICLHNKSQDPISSVTATCSGKPALGSVTGWDTEVTTGFGSVPARAGSRFYWDSWVEEKNIVVEFTDAAGVRWRLHHRDGLSEVTGQE